MHILLTNVLLDCRGWGVGGVGGGGRRVPVTGMLAGMNLSILGMNLSKPGKKHNNYVIIYFKIGPAKILNSNDKLHIWLRHRAQHTQQYHKIEDEDHACIHCNCLFIDHRYEGTKRGMSIIMVYCNCYKNTYTWLCWFLLCLGFIIALTKLCYWFIRCLEENELLTVTE